MTEKIAVHVTNEEQWNEAKKYYDLELLDFEACKHVYHDGEIMMFDEAVEMTVTEKEVMTRFICSAYSFTQFIDAIINGCDSHNVLYREAEKVFKKRDIRDGYVLNERPLMQAWLKPETIKAVDEEEK